MKTNPTILPDAVLRRMSPEDRKKLGKAGVTAEEAQASFVAKNERELQSQIASLLRRNRIWTQRDPMHKRRTGTPGTPDFLFAVNGRAIAWEVKFGGGKLRPDQIAAKVAMEANGWNWDCIESLSQAQIALRTLNQAQERAGGEA